MKRVEGQPLRWPIQAGAAPALQSSPRDYLEKNLNGCAIATISGLTMIKITTTALVAIGMLMTSSVFAGDKACCANGASKAASMACVNLATLNLTPDQKTKIEAWQTECMKAGCTKESRKIFLKQSKGILSAQQFAQLKAQCGKTAKAKKSEA
jgi:hypothetical protein